MKMAVGGFTKTQARQPHLAMVDSQWWIERLVLPVIGTKSCNNPIKGE